MDSLFVDKSNPREPGISCENHSINIASPRERLLLACLKDNLTGSPPFFPRGFPNVPIDNDLARVLGGYHTRAVGWRTCASIRQKMRQGHTPRLGLG